MKKRLSAGLLIVALSFAWPVISFAESGRTAAQEQAEQHAQPSQTREQIEATEEKVLGHDAHQKLEVLHVASESNPVLALSLLLAALLLATVALGYVVKRKKSHKKRS